MLEGRGSRRSFSQSFKVEAVKLVTEGGYTVLSASSNLGIGASTLGKWVRVSRQAADAEAAFPGKGHQKPREAAYRALERELARVKQERDILKKAVGYFANPQE